MFNLAQPKKKTLAHLSVFETRARTRTFCDYRRQGKDRDKEACPKIGTVRRCDFILTNKQTHTLNYHLANLSNLSPSMKQKTETNNDDQSPIHTTQNNPIAVNVNRV